MTVSIDSGASINFIYTIKDQDGDVVDLTGGSISFVVSKIADSAALITKSGALTDAANGVTTISLAPADTTSLQGLYVLKGTYTDASSNVYVFDEQGLGIK